MKIFMVAILSFVSFLFARIHCENLDRYGYENLTEDAKLQLVNSLKQNLEAEYRNECIAKGGKGSAFTIHPGRVVKVCADISGSASGYLRVEMLCDYCSGEKMQGKLKAIEEDCKNGCMESVAYCQKPDLIYEGGWGGEIVNDDECGETLPECQSVDSSSSQDDESSSSEDLSSSSEESSSSVEESSSSENDENSSGSEEDVDESSSSGGESGCGEGGDHCTPNPFGYKEGLHLCSTEVTYFHGLYGNYCNEELFCGCYNSNSNAIKFFTQRPNYYGELEFLLFCNVQQDDPTVLIETNLPYITVERRGVAYCFDDMESCERGKIRGYRYSISIPTIYGCRANSLSYAVPMDQEKGCSVTKNTNSDNAGMLFVGRKVTENSTLTSLDWLYSPDDFPANFDFNELLREPRIVEGFESCLRSLKDYNSLKSSSSQYSSSSEEISSSSENFSSSSSFYEYSSSDEKIIETSSSDVIYVYSSSSEKVNEPFVAGPDQEYSLDQIFNSGLQNMEEGKCYSLNPERGSQYGWINNNAQDSWWWVDVPCDGSMPIVEKTSAGCVKNKRGSNAVYHPSDCFSSGLDNMTPGKCYSLNPERGTQYGWINNNAQDTWWWVEAPCEKEKNRGLYKKATRDVFMAENDDEPQDAVERPSFYFDALGRTMNRRNAFGEKRSVYGKIRDVR